jgi:hypothetical protein
MAGFLLRPRAVVDVDSIWTYTVQNWGEDQAERYVRKINERSSLYPTSLTLGTAAILFGKDTANTEWGVTSSSIA